MDFSHDRHVSPPFVGKYYAIIPSSSGDKFNFIKTDTGFVIRLDNNDINDIYETWDSLGRSPGVTFERYLHGEFNKRSKGGYS